MSSTHIQIAALAFVAPLVIVCFLHREEIEERVKVDPKTAAGKVLFFTAPSR